MKRRDALKSLAVAAGTLGVGGAAAASTKTEDKLNTRKVFKIVEQKPPMHVVQVGSEQWEPTPDDMDAIVEAFQQAKTAQPTDVIVTSHHIDIQPAFIMVQIEFKDLKKGDRFVLYEHDGSLVNDEGIPVWECEGDAYVADGIDTVQSKPVRDDYYEIPKRYPA